VCQTLAHLENNLSSKKEGRRKVGKEKLYTLGSGELIEWRGKNSIAFGFLRESGACCEASRSYERDAKKGRKGRKMTIRNPSAQ